LMNATDKTDILQLSFHELLRGWCRYLLQKWRTTYGESA
jgi:hypothetical protein